MVAIIVVKFCEPWIAILVLDVSTVVGLVRVRLMQPYPGRWRNFLYLELDISVTMK